MKTVMPGGAAYKDGHLLPNDQIIEINGERLDGKSNAQAMECLRSAMQSDPPSGVIDLVVRRRTDSKNSVLRPLGVRRFTEESGHESAIDVGCDADHESDATSPESTFKQRRKSLPSVARPKSAGRLKDSVDMMARNRRSTMALHERSYSADLTELQALSQQQEGEACHPPSPLMLKSPRLPRSPQKSPRSARKSPLQPPRMPHTISESSTYLSPGEVSTATPTQLRETVSVNSIDIEVTDTSGKLLAPSSSMTSLTSGNRSPFVLPLSRCDAGGSVSPQDRENKEPTRSKPTTPIASSGSSPKLMLKHSPKSPRASQRVSQTSSVTSSPNRKQNGSVTHSVSTDETVEPLAKRQPLHETQQVSVTEEKDEREASPDVERDSPFQRDAVGRLSMSERRKTALDPSSSKVYQERQQKMAGQHVQESAFE